MWPAMPAVAYLGPAGTFTEQAARDLAGPGAELCPMARVPAVVQAVEAGEVDAAVVAFENSLEGSIPGNLDQILLETDRCLIAGERVLPVSFVLYRAPDDHTPLHGVSSHPFGLAQCSRFVAEHSLEVRETLSTALACEELAAGGRPGWGALAPRLAGELHGLRAEREGLEDDGRATTRFVLLRRACPGPTGQDHTAFAFRPRSDQPGSLVRLLQEFSVRGINLTAIKSRPTKELLGEYVFYIECEGHIADPRLRDAVLGLLRFEGETRFLGSFPQDPARPRPAASAGPDTGHLAYAEMLGRVEVGPGP
jgi:prephenate dehydratase